MKDYDPGNWYWIVAGSTTQVYSSASGDYVPINDATYTAWLSDGTLPTKILNEEELGEVLADQSVRPANAAVLDRYQDNQARKLTLRVVAKVLFYFANEIRTLKGQQPINANQFRNWLKGLM